MRNIGSMHLIPDELLSPAISASQKDALMNAPQMQADLTGRRSIQEALQSRLQLLRPDDEAFAVQAVDLLLAFAGEHQASDLHLLPTVDRHLVEVLYRIDGVLHPAGMIVQKSMQLIPRLKVLAQLLTYVTDVPQEGRIRSGGADREMRVSTFPTVHGEKAVVRFFVAGRQFQKLDELGFPADVLQSLQGLLSQTSGLLLVCGPAGSGKTTTLYAAMRHLQGSATSRKSLCTLEDPIEALLPGVAQTQIKPDGELTYQKGLAALLRQDPEVILVGEIRDRETASIVFQASLTGQFVLSSFHSGSAAEAISRLSDMEIEPYLLRSGLKGVLAQRLLRRCCDCRAAGTAGCLRCRSTGYSGRILICELLQTEATELGRAILTRDDAARIQELAEESGMKPLRQRVQISIDAGLTTREEAQRIFGTRC